MHDELHSIANVDYCGDYMLELRFEDGAEKRIDFEPVLHGSLFAPLRDQKLFRQATIETETGVLEWPNGADFDPSMLYYWERHVERLAQQLRAAESASK